MTPEQQRIAIAEVCGWRVVQKMDGEYLLFDPKGNTVSADWEEGTSLASFAYLLPDYLNDLNAMHEAEAALHDDLANRNYQCRNYADCLILIQSRDKGLEPSDFGRIRATAAQRAEAFLRTLNLWKEND